MAPATTLSKTQSPRTGGSFNQPISLQVPYLCQLDSVTAQSLRMCFSSTCAMAAAYLKPGCLVGAGQLDDRYLGLLQRHGDTTDAAAQIQTLRRLGIQAELRTDGRIEQLIAQLRLGIPVPVGWLHKGPVNAPSGGGHWSLVVGWDPAQRTVLMHDPNGEADLVGGGYVSTAIGSGRNRWYSEKNWGRRWMVEGVGSGWWLELAG
ncbi:papain-like cysteine protease family protein [Vulcanococcus limneticus]|uniref:papain-like cysteine protease family protein n=1 Tax=Vulcanococcus limneticus TaxID=2170428 RepID=UPI00398BDABE